MPPCPASYVGTGAGSQALIFWIEMQCLGCAILPGAGLFSSQDDGVEDNEKNFYDSDDEEEEKSGKKKPYAMDPDHRLLIRNTKPLLQSRNAAVCWTKKNCFSGLKTKPWQKARVSVLTV